MEIALNHGKVVIIDDADAPLVAGYRWRAGRGRNTWYAYTVIRRDGKRLAPRMHQVIMNSQRGEIVDHRDRDGLNNRRSNLRKCTTAQNICNGCNRKNNTSGFHGVSWDKSRQRWSAAIKYSRRMTHLGRHATAEAAARAYDAAARQYHGEFARLNFPEVEGALTNETAPAA